MAVVNTVASAGLALDAGGSSIAAGAYSQYAPADSVPLYGGTDYNFGYRIDADADSSAINSTVVYRDDDSGAYAVIYAFAEDPSLPGMFGVSVNSNVNVDTIVLESTLLANEDTTELVVTVHVDPPASEATEAFVPAQ